MKKLIFIFLITFALACNNKKNHDNQNNTTIVTVAIGTQISPDSLKPPIIKQVGTPKVFVIPTKAGGSYLYTYPNGDTAKIYFKAPVTKALPVVVTDLNGVSMPPTPTPSKDQSPAAIGNFTTFTSDQGLALDAIAAGFKDSKGNLWFGTWGGGVSRYDGKSFTNFTMLQGLANNTVLSISQDSKENLWFGTSGGGVSRYDGKSFTNYTTAQGLAYNYVRSITQDSKGNLWF
ncbi:MAG: two-component regulator propeller domain-containing protein, partial [Bacteroidota bacterium]